MSKTLEVNITSCNVKKIDLKVSDGGAFTWIVSCQTRPLM